MPRLTRQTYFAVLSVFALLTQLLAPSLAMASGVSPSLICNPTGHISAEMQAGIDELKEILGIDDTDDAVMDCQDCVTSVHLVPMPSFDLAVLLKWTSSFADLISHKFILANPRGPPLGSRAPPVSVVT
jgi:hypothetical protein